MQVATVNLGEQALVFSGVTELHIPREQLWGASVAINAVRETGPERFEVELQSGDVLRVHAASWNFGEVSAAGSALTIHCIGPALTTLAGPLNSDIGRL